MTRHEKMFRHELADRLDDPERRVWLPVDDVVRGLDLRAGMVVADIGAGTGYFARPLARAVAPAGEVLAVDLQPQMLERLRGSLTSDLSIRLIQAEATRTTLDASSVDVVFTANVWHELDDRGAALVEFARILRPAGRLAVLDWRTDVSSPPGPPLEHRVTASAVVEMLGRAGWSGAAATLVGKYSYLVVATSRLGRSS